MIPVTGAAASDCPVLSLTDSLRGEALRGAISALQDPSWQLKAADLAGPDSVMFHLLDSPIPDFGYTKSRLWLRLCVENTGQNTNWRLYVHENFFQVFEAYIARADGRIEELVALDKNSPFDARVIRDPELIAPFVLAPGEQATLLISYWSGGASQVDFSLETAAGFDANSATRTAKNFLFYGMMLLLVTIAMLSFVLVQHVVFLAYSAYAVSALLFVMHGDGAAFQYLWPNAPAFNSNASVFTGSALIVCGAIYARVFLQTPVRHRVLDRLLLAIVVITLGLDLALFIPATQLLKKLLIMLSLASVLSFTLAGVVSYFAGYREVRFYTLAWLGAVLSSGLMNMRHVLGVEIPQETVHDSIRVVMVLDAMMMGLAIADRYNQLRRSRQLALEENLRATRQGLDLNRRLGELQAQHDLAVELAKSRDHHIQNVVHDLRQPLHALRLNVMTLTAGKGSGAATPSSVENAFSYLEKLIAEHLEDTTHVSHHHDSPSENTPGVQEILCAIEEMFQTDAAERGLSLRRVPSTLEAPVNALLATRILSNLVANAIKYTETGGVLIGTRRRGDTLRIEVHDTGPGMSRADFETARKRRVRLDRNGAPLRKGHGLGLAIAIDLAERNGLRIEHLDWRRGGTGMALVLPYDGA